MREIKFRAWDSDKGYFIPNEAFNALLDGGKIAGQHPPVVVETTVKRSPIVGTWDGLIVKDIPIYVGYEETIEKEYEQPVEYLQGNPFTMEQLSLMQYTGLKDKNGVEIYEGDIVLYPKLEKDQQGQVVWRNAGFMVIPITSDPFMLGGYISISGKSVYEVIGNIHENPELLEK